MAKSLDPHREIFFDAFFQKKDILNNYLEIAAAKRTYQNFAGWILPVIIQMHVNKYDGKLYKASKFLKGFLGQERVNLKIILGNRNVFRAGYEIGNGKITRIVENGLNNPTISVVATESAIHRIERSKDPMAALQKEGELGGIAISGQSLSAKLKLEVLISSIQVLRIFNNFSFG